MMVAAILPAEGQKTPVLGDRQHVDAKDEASLARTVLAQASKGGIRTETLRAFTEEEYRKIIGSLP